MNQIIESIKAQLHEADVESVLDLLYAGYMNTDPIDQERIDRHYQQLEEHIQALDFHRQDQIYSTMTSLCAEQDHIAFLDGVRTGARLILELLDL